MFHFRILKNDLTDQSNKDTENNACKNKQATEHEGI